MNVEYIEFIKKFLIHKLYLDYTYTQTQTQTQTETDIWNEVFNKNRAVLKYHLQLSKSTKTNANVTKTNNQGDIYKDKTFQDYIDETINIQTINQVHYQEFIKSMKDESFKRNFQNKYEDYITETKVKNHLIYIVQIIIKSQNQNQNQYYTETEEYEMDTSLNVIPYLEYVSYQDHAQEDENENQEKVKTMNEKTIETMAIQAINDFLFT